ncbi:1-phosphatidylinositol 4,5-bisphosphate phosphodiesterase zeta-1 [Pelodytes ibericus]
MFLALNVSIDVIHAKYIFKVTDHERNGLISTEGFKSIYRAFTLRKELVDLFNKYAVSQRMIPAAKLLTFIRKDLFQFSANEEVASGIIAQFEPIMEAKKQKCLTFQGFVRFMNSPDNHIFRKEQSVIYQDMTRPLSDYYISTSHNTYLISDQLVGQSHLWGYSSAMMKGCRCLEIDCWDGPNGEPVVFHGRTLTSKLLFKTVIYVIEKYAFTASHFPLILSLENHCSPPQQETMAHYLKIILGDKLLTMTIGNSFSSTLPSPQDLKYKILIKNKKIGLLQDTILSHGVSRRGQVGELIEPIEEDEEGSDKEEKTLKVNNNKSGLKLKFNKKEYESKIKAKVEKLTLSLELSDLVIYTKSVKFKSFQHSRTNQKFYENNSLVEGTAEKFAKNSAQEFISHNMKFITRIYPRGSRTSSSNFNPQTFWNVGCQMVALNFQTSGTSMDLQNGKFLDNGGCGYVLKPEFLRNPKSKFDPFNLHPGTRPITLSIKIISGFLLPPSSLSASNTADVVVFVEVFGAPADQSKKQTLVVKSNAFNPQWNQTLSFTIHAPELALVRFSLEGQLALISNESLGQYTLPLTCMNKGYRHVPLLNKHGQSLVPASLFVNVWYLRCFSPAQVPPMASHLTPAQVPPMASHLTPAQVPPLLLTCTGTSYGISTDVPPMASHLTPAQVPPMASHLTPAQVPPLLLTCTGTSYGISPDTCTGTSSASHLHRYLLWHLF